VYEKHKEKINVMRKGLSIKYVHSQRGGGCPVRTFFDKEGPSDADVRTFWCKNFGFFEICGVSAWTRVGGVIYLVRTLFGQGGWAIFLNFVRASFMDHPL